MIPAFRPSTHDLSDYQLETLYQLVTQLNTREPNDSPETHLRIVQLKSQDSLLIQRSIRELLQVRLEIQIPNVLIRDFR